ncbi:MAG TPA: hypothetical protein VLL54_18990 [Pyrinomonadaceae bacterium]|nr:hypothetical protein [Pyrinomonadaceae bacterium]
MGKINYGRLILGTIVAGVFYFLTDGAIHTMLGPYHLAAITGAGKATQPQDQMAFVYFAIYDLGKGLVALLVYAGVRPRFGAGLKTAAWAGVVTWLACIVVPTIAAIPFPFYEKIYFYKLMGLSIIPVIVGAILGAAIYKE